MGTMGYLSPEQAQSRPLGPTSDVFSLGVVLYEISVGRLPFEGDNAATWIHAIVYDDPEPLRAFRPDAPPELERITRRALQKRIERRFADGEELEAALVALQAALPEPKLPEEGPVEERDGATPDPVVLSTHGRLVGRQAEFDLLREMLRAVAAGQGRAIWVAGEAGCGKTRLLAELAHHAERSGVLVLRTACRVRQGVRPYQPFAEMFEAYLARRGARTFAGLGDHLDRIEPGLGRWAAVLANLLQLQASGLEAPISREQVLDAVTSILTALSRRQPVLLLVEDLHWAEAETLDLVHFLLPNLSRARILLTGSYRPEEMVATEGALHPLARLLERAEREAASTRVTLRRLDSAETAELAEEMLGGGHLPSAFLDQLHRRTEGNPLYAVELIKMLRAEGVLQPDRAGGLRVAAAEETVLPGRVRDIIERRLRHLGAGQRRLLEVAAVEGTLFHASTLEACLDRSHADVLGLLQDLERDLQLIHGEGEGYRFDHLLIRDVLVETLAEEDRRETHRRIGRHLIRRFGARSEQAAAIAYQLVEARDHVQALPYLMTAARVARRVFSNDAAIGYLDQAERILLSAREDRQPEVERAALLMKVHERRGELLQMVGRNREAMRDFRSLEERATRASDSLRLAMARNRMGMLRAHQGDYDGALSAARSAREAARLAEDSRALAEADEVEGLVHFHKGAFDDALACHGEAMKRRRMLRDHAGLAHNLNKIGNIRYYQGNYEAALAAYQSARALERDLGDQRGMAESLMNLGATFLQMGDHAASLEHHEAALTIKREIGDRRSMAMSLNNLALVHEARGRLVEARSCHEESLAIKREIGDHRGISIALSNLASLHERMGYLQQALEAAEESLSIKRSIQDRMSFPYALNQLGAVLLALGQVERAEASHREALEITRDVGDRTEEAHSLRRLGDVALERDDPGPGCGPLAESLALARELKAREAEMEALYSLGRAQVRAGRLDSAEATAAAMEPVASQGAAEYLAKSHRLAGLLAAARSEREEARQRFQAALGLAAEVGLRDLQWRLHLDLASTREGGEHSPEAREDRARARILVEELAARLSRPDLRAGFLACRGPRSALHGDDEPDR
jgi:predicted ATPase